jgi:hypothetical protein
MINPSVQQRIDKEVLLALNELNQAASKNQKHPQELLLVEQHGHYYKSGKKKLLMVGPGEVGLSAFSHLNFISHQAQNFLWKTETDVALFEGDELLAVEQTIHLEKLI